MKNQKKKNQCGMKLKNIENSTQISSAVGKASSGFSIPLIMTEKVSVFSHQGRKQEIDLDDHSADHALPLAESHIGQPASQKELGYYRWLENRLQKQSTEETKALCQSGEGSLMDVFIANI